VGDVGLVLTGGGARAAYQVGVSWALGEILGSRMSPFSVFTGVSAGAINAVALGAGADDFSTAATRLREVWLKLTPDRVYRTDAGRLLGIGSRWMRDLSAGAVFGSSRINFLLDTSPLQELLTQVLPIPRLRRHFASGLLRGVAVTATNYLTGMAVSFFDGQPPIQPWIRSTRAGVREKLRLHHVMASAAIPIFFPPVRIRGAFYGDGCVRLSAPLSPAIHLGAERIVAVSVRQWREPEHLLTARHNRGGTLAASEIAGVLMNAVFLDSLEADVERLERVNTTVSILTPEQREQLPHALRNVPILVLRPSLDLGALAEDQYKRFPRMLRYLLKGIGADNGNGSDLLSYLAFEPVYVSRLVQLGYEDTLERRGELEDFLALSARRSSA
jgi:NTE family protein